LSLPEGCRKVEQEVFEAGASWNLSRWAAFVAVALIAGAVGLYCRRPRVGASPAKPNLAALWQVVETYPFLSLAVGLPTVILLFLSLAALAARLSRGQGRPDGNVVQRPTVSHADVQWPVPTGQRVKSGFARWRRPFPRRIETMTAHAELLPRYQHLRQVAFQLNNRLVPTLPKSVMDEGGKKLRILKKNVLVLDSADEIAVLADFCIYDVRHKGLNAIERFLAESPPPADSDEIIILQAMRQARFCLLAAESIERGVGVQCRDLLRDESVFVMDVGFGSTAIPDLVLAARLMAPEGITMTTGAALPFGMVPTGNHAEFLQSVEGLRAGLDIAKCSPEAMSEFTAAIIQLCLERGAAEHIEYREPGSSYREPPGRSWRDRRPSAPPPARHVGRNSPCPCGSGKKFKNCCRAPR
jgi:hypothetical protein